jgi:broad specificity phosphatase PhoE
MQACTIYIVRHGQSVANRDDVMGTDAALTDLGRKQAHQAKKILSTVDFDAAYSSTMLRAADTAAIIWGEPLPVDQQLDDLRERNFGTYDSQPLQLWTDMNVSYYEKYGALPLEERWQKLYGESIETTGSLMERFLRGVTTIAHNHPDETVLLVAHAGPLRMILAKLGYAQEEELPFGCFENAAYIVLECDGIDFKVKKVTGVTKSILAAA